MRKSRISIEIFTMNHKNTHKHQNAVKWSHFFRLERNEFNVWKSVFFCVRKLQSKKDLKQQFLFKLYSVPSRSSLRYCSEVMHLITVNLNDRLHTQMRSFFLFLSLPDVFSYSFCYSASILMQKLQLYAHHPN